MKIIYETLPFNMNTIGGFAAIDQFLQKLETIEKENKNMVISLKICLEGDE